MKILVLHRSFAAVLICAAFVLSFSPQIAWAQSPSNTTLEIGPREVILNNTVISAMGWAGSPRFPDCPWQVSYNGTSQMNYFIGSGSHGITHLVGSLDNPIATSYLPEVDLFNIGTNHESDGGPMGNQTEGGPMYQLSNGDLLMWYCDNQTCTAAGGGYNYVGMAISTNGGTGWTDLGEILRSNVPYSENLTGSIQTGEPGNVVVDPTGSYFYLYTWITTSTLGINDSAAMYVGLSRASIKDVTAAAVAGGVTTGGMALWYDFNTAGGGTWTTPADGGLPCDIIGTSAQSADVAWSSIVFSQYLNKYIMFGENAYNWYEVDYRESTDGKVWTGPREIMPVDFDGSFYFGAVGIEPNIPQSLGGQPSFAVNGEFYLNYSTLNQAWQGYSGVSTANPYMSRRKVYVLDNFDNDTVNATPGGTGWTDTGWQTVSGFANAEVEASPTPGTGHPNALEINDTSSSTTAGADKLFYANGSATSAPAMEYHAEIYPVSFSGGSIRQDLLSGSTLAFVTAIAPPNTVGNYSDYTLQTYNVATSTWSLIGGANGHLGTTGITGLWHSIDINATSLSSATVTLDHVVIGTIPAASSVTSLDRVRISSGSNAGESTFYVDNVFLYPSEPGDTFENNTVSPALLPNGWTQAQAGFNGSTLITSAGSFTGGYTNAFGPGTQSMEILQEGTGAVAEAARIVDPSSSKWFEAQVYPVSSDSWGRLEMDLSSGAATSGAIVYKVAMIAPSNAGAGNYSDYTLQYGSGGNWHLLRDLGTASPNNAWHQIDIDATSTTAATVYYEGTSVGSITYAQTTTPIDRVILSAGDYRSTGFKAYVDNIYFTPALLNDNDFAFDQPGTLPWGYSLVSGSGTSPTLTNSSTGIAGYDSPNALHIKDSTTIAEVQKIAAAQYSEPTALGGGSVNFEIYPGNPTTAGLHDIVSLVYSSTTVAQLAIGYDTSTGQRLYYNQGGNGWTKYGSPLTANTWHNINFVVAESISNAPAQQYGWVKVMLDGVSVFGWTGLGNVLKTAPSIDRVIFSCSSVADDFYVDDVIFN